MKHIFSDIVDEAEIPLSNITPDQFHFDEQIVEHMMNINGVQ